MKGRSLQKHWSRCFAQHLKALHKENCGTSNLYLRSYVWEWIFLFTSMVPKERGACFYLIKTLCLIKTKATDDITMTIGGMSQKLLQERWVPFQFINKTPKCTLVVIFCLIDGLSWNSMVKLRFGKGDFSSVWIVIELILTIR